LGSYDLGNQHKNQQPTQLMSLEHWQTALRRFATWLRPFRSIQGECDSMFCSFGVHYSNLPSKKSTKRAGLRQEKDLIDSIDDVSILFQQQFLPLYSAPPSARRKKWWMKAWTARAQLQPQFEGQVGTPPGVRGVTPCNLASEPYT